MTLKQMRDDAKTRCAYTASDLDASFTTWINRGYYNVGRRYLWPFLEKEGTVTTSASTETYSLPSDLLHLYVVRDTTNDTVLQFVRIAEFYKYEPNPTATGAPYLYRLPGASQSTSTDTPAQQISFYPIPGGTYTIKVAYYKRLTALVNDSDVPLLPEEFHELLIDYACSVFFSRQGDTRAVSHRDLYENGLLDMAELLNAEPADRVEVVGSTDDNRGIPTVRFPSSFGYVPWRR